VLTTLVGEKQGISLSVAQYEALLAALPQVNAALEKQGVDLKVPSPGQASSPHVLPKSKRLVSESDASAKDTEEDDEADGSSKLSSTKQKKKANKGEGKKPEKAPSKKANYEATSEEEV